jgi:hypothetical protein
MDIPAPGLNIRLQIGDTIDDGHENLSFSFGTFALCSMQEAVHPTASRSHPVAGMAPNAVVAGLVPVIHV